MKIKYNSLILMFLALFLIVSCTKDLRLVPKDQLTEVGFWTNSNDFTLAANAFYSTLPTFNYADEESDIAFGMPNSLSNGKLQTSDESGVWNNAYISIRNANVFLGKAALSTGLDIKRYVAEVKFFRAFTYWNLFRIYGGVPIIDKVYEPLDPGLFSPRASSTETVDFILKDLNEAIVDLPKQKELAAADVGRITSGTALALKARVSLFHGTWEKSRNGSDANKYLDMAIASANEVISSNNYSLFTGKGDQSYRYLFIDEGDDSPESILDHRYARSISGHSYSYSVEWDGYLATKKLTDMYLDKNGLPISKSSIFQGYNTVISEFANRDPRMTMTWLIPGTKIVMAGFPIIPVECWPDHPQRNPNTCYTCYKYLSEEEYANSRGTGEHKFDCHLIRYAEVLLIYAEALYEKNGTVSDADLNKSINLLRDRVNMPHLTNSFVSNNQLDMRDEIRRERTVELALEGFRRDDLRRWKTAEVELPKDVKGIKIKGSEWENMLPYKDVSYQNRVDGNGFLIVESGRIFNPGKDYLQPLPVKEVAFYIENGHSLQQNPGW